MPAESAVKNKNQIIFNVTLQPLQPKINHFNQKFKTNVKYQLKSVTRTHKLKV